MDSHKKYYDFTNEISSTEIYKGLLAFGLFTEKLPPVFSSKSFFDYCQTNNPSFPHKPTEYIYFESMRNTNVPRALGIPNPATYQLLCKYLSEVWPELQKFFEEQTKDQNHIISRIHIRQMQNTNSLFLMNYKNWRIDGTPEPDLLLGAKYLVHADISNCFPSIYTHALSWALVGKDLAKQTRNDSNAWYNKLDLYVRNIKAGETHGLLIGPHISNLLSEIILATVYKGNIIKFNNGLPILRRDTAQTRLRAVFLYLGKKGGTTPPGPDEKSGPFFHVQNQEVNVYAR